MSQGDTEGRIIMKTPFPVYEFRPVDNDGAPFLRYNNGVWIPDDGEWDLAFISAKEAGGAPMAYHIEVPYHEGLLWSWCERGNWRIDVAKHPGGNPWHRMTKDGKETQHHLPNRDMHPNMIAARVSIDQCCRLHGCANGSWPNFHINDPYIAQGKLRLRDTKEVVVFPDIFDCIWCGKMDWRKIEAESSQNVK